MKTIHFILILIFLTACNGGNSQSPEPINGDVLTIKASGLNGSVTLYETISKRHHKINSDGIYDISLPSNQSIYDLEIVDSNQQICRLNVELDLVCLGQGASATVVIPVCAKNPNVGIQCITAPCHTAQYLTYSNSCFAGLDNSRSVISTGCGELEDVLAFHHQKPAHITNLALLDIFTGDFDIINSNITDDTLTIEFEISGGCGSHTFSLFADEVFLESDPVQLSTAISHVANDACDSLIRIEKEFDLLPIKEIYRRAYPTSTGENSIILNNFGTYQFTLN